jgi:hypothetical protein
MSMKVINNIALMMLAMSCSAAVSARMITGKIVDMISWDDGHTFIKIENGPTNGCSDQYSYSLGVRGLDVKAESMLSIALSAYIAGRSVTIVTEDGSCQGGQERIRFIQLLPK